MEIETKRLVLRTSENNRDLENYKKHLYEAGDAEMLYCMEPSPELFSEINFENGWVIYFTVFLKETDEMIGYVGLTVEYGPDWVEGFLEYYIFNAHRRQGFCREAVEALTEDFFGGRIVDDRGTKVTATVSPANTASEAVVKSMGFEEKGIQIAWVGLTEPKRKLLMVYSKENEEAA